MNNDRAGLTCENFIVCWTDQKMAIEAFILVNAGQASIDFIVQKLYISKNSEAQLKNLGRGILWGITIAPAR